jgi:hypothetical protein
MVIMPNYAAVRADGFPQNLDELAAEFSRVN